jgi:hypothetical protein
MGEPAPRCGSWGYPGTTARLLLCKWGWNDGAVVSNGGDSKEGWVLVCLDLLWLISGPFLFGPWGFKLEFDSLRNCPFSFGLEYLYPPATPEATPDLGDRVLGRTLWVGGSETVWVLEEDGRMEVLKVAECLLPKALEVEEALPSSWVSSSSSLMKI